MQRGDSGVVGTDSYIVELAREHTLGSRTQGSAEEKNGVVDVFVTFARNVAQILTANDSFDVLLDIRFLSALREIYAKKFDR